MDLDKLEEMHKKWLIQHNLSLNGSFFVTEKQLEEYGEFMIEYKKKKEEMNLSFVDCDKVWVFLNVSDRSLPRHEDIGDALSKAETNPTIHCKHIIFSGWNLTERSIEKIEKFIERIFSHTISIDLSNTEVYGMCENSESIMDKFIGNKFIEKIKLHDHYPIEKLSLSIRDKIVLTKKENPEEEDEKEEEREDWFNLKSIVYNLSRKVKRYHEILLIDQTSNDEIRILVLLYEMNIPYIISRRLLSRYANMYKWIKGNPNRIKAQTALQILEGLAEFTDRLY